MRCGIDQTILWHDVEKKSKKFYVANYFLFFIKEPSKTVSIYPDTSNLRTGYRLTHGRKAPAARKAFRAPRNSNAALGLFRYHFSRRT